MGLEPADPPDQLTPPFVGLFANIHIILLLVDWVLHFPRPFFSTCPSSCLAARHLALSSPCHVFLFIFSHFFLLFILPFWFILCLCGHCCPWSCPNFPLICHLQTSQCSSHSNLFLPPTVYSLFSFSLLNYPLPLPISPAVLSVDFWVTRLLSSHSTAPMWKICMEWDILCLGNVNIMWQLESGSRFYNYSQDFPSFFYFSFIMAIFYTTWMYDFNLRCNRRDTLHLPSFFYFWFCVKCY